jgi:hypothetical protein
VEKNAHTHWTWPIVPNLVDLSEHVSYFNTNTRIPIRKIP